MIYSRTNSLLCSSARCDPPQLCARAAAESLSTCHIPSIRWSDFFRNHKCWRFRMSKKRAKKAVVSGACVCTTSCVAMQSQARSQKPQEKHRFIQHDVDQGGSFAPLSVLRHIHPTTTTDTRWQKHLWNGVVVNVDIALPAHNVCGITLSFRYSSMGSCRASQCGQPCLAPSHRLRAWR